MPISFIDQLTKGFTGDDPLVLPDDLLREAEYGVTFPTGSAAYLGRLFVFAAVVGVGLAWKDTDGATDLTGASVGDLARYDGTDWIKIGNVRGLANVNVTGPTINGGVAAPTAADRISGTKQLFAKTTSPYRLFYHSGDLADDFIPAGSDTRFTTSVPLDSSGENGDIALVRVSSIVVHAYEKVGGVWVRQWAFSGGDAIFLTGNLPVLADRQPATDPDSATYTRFVGLTPDFPFSGSSIDDAQPVINQFTDWFGGNHGTQTSAPANTLPNQEFGTNLEDYITLSFNPAYSGIYLWFGIDASESVGLSIASVSYNGVDVDIIPQAQVYYGGHLIDVWGTLDQYYWSQIKDHPFVLVIEQDPNYPNTYNRYAVVTQNPNPTAADFLSSGATHSLRAILGVPQSGWVDGRGYLHFALPADQPAPTIAGIPGGTNLIDDFDVRSTAAAIAINGDQMRTISSEHLVFQLTDEYGLFPWVVR